MYAQGFAWSSHGIAPDMLDKLYELLTPELGAKLPAARAAFAKRCEDGLGHVGRRRARTPIPDCALGAVVLGRRLR